MISEEKANNLIIDCNLVVTRLLPIESEFYIIEKQLRPIDIQSFGLFKVKRCIKLSRSDYKIIETTKNVRGLNESFAFCGESKVWVKK